MPGGVTFAASAGTQHTCRPDTIAERKQLGHFVGLSAAAALQNAGAALFAKPVAVASNGNHR